MATALGPYDARCGVLLKQDWYRNESLRSRCLGRLQLDHVLLSSSGRDPGCVSECVIHGIMADSSQRLAGTTAICDERSLGELIYLVFSSDE